MIGKKSWGGAGGVVLWALLSPSGLRLPVVVLSIVYTKADWKSGAAARMSKEESNYGQKEERRGENPPRIDFLLSPGKGQSGALSRLVPPREFLSNSETALDEPRRTDGRTRSGTDPNGAIH